MFRPVLVAMLVAVGLLAAFGTAHSSGNGRTSDPLGIAVAPQTLVLSKSQGAVSVHTAIPYRSVDLETLVLSSSLGACVPTWTKADLRGDLVAYFNEAEVEAIVAVPSTRLTLSGETDAGPFSGSDTVSVKN